MNARIRWGLISGVIGFFANIVASLIFGFCGPVIGFGVGVLGGFLLTQQESSSNKRDGAIQGAITGSVAGVFLFLGQIIAAAGSLAFTQLVDVDLVIGTLPDPTDPGQLVLFWISGLSVGACIGIMDVVASVAGGALIGYIRTPKALNHLGGDSLQE